MRSEATGCAAPQDSAVKMMGSDRSAALPMQSKKDGNYITPDEGKIWSQDGRIAAVGVELSQFGRDGIFIFFIGDAEPDSFC